MNCRADFVDLSRDDDDEGEPVKVKKPGVADGSLEQICYQEAQLGKHHSFKTQLRAHEFKEISSTSVLERGQSLGDDDDAVVSSVATVSPVPICRQFWKAGSYQGGTASKVTLQNNKNYLQVHPMFLHSNATSHKWAFGAVAELLDNAIDEIPNGATFVIVDKISLPKDGTPALLIQDNGAGMDPDAMRHCMSFGFSDKKSKSAIGQYGNGFKTSSMRLGADVIVFSRHLNSRSLTQSIGLLSYTFLTRTAQDRIVVPMVDYEFNTLTGRLEVLHDRDMAKLSILLKWSPYSTEAGLLKQFDDIGPHGTKIVIYNLWHSNNGNLELDFDTDSKDIRIEGDTRKRGKISDWRAVHEQHISNQYQYSLRVYMSILYLRVPKTFRMVLRGKVVEHHNVVDELKYIQYIHYKPQVIGKVEGEVVTTIGFLNDAPLVNIHGFCVYHKNRLILPFWHVVNYERSRGRGVVGALEANFIVPTHNKQDFERTPLFQKLECRLKDMTWEYWDFNCHLIGYQPTKKLHCSVFTQVSSHYTDRSSMQQPLPCNQSSAAVGRTEAGSASGQAEDILPNSHSGAAQGLHKRKELGDLAESEKFKRQAVNGSSAVLQPANTPSHHLENRETTLIQKRMKLQAKCSEYEKREEGLNARVTQLRTELEEVQRVYDWLQKELQSLDVVKGEKYVYI